MHFHYSIYISLNIGAAIASNAGVPSSTLTVRRVSDNFARSRFYTLKTRQDNENEPDPPECIDPEKQLFFCSMCGDKGVDGKCKGVTDDVVTDQWKGCACTDDPDWSLEPLPLNRPDYPEHQQAFRDHDKLEDDWDTPQSEPIVIDWPWPFPHNKTLSIVADYPKNPLERNGVDWKFFAADLEAAKVECRQDPLTSRKDGLGGGVNGLVYPGGTFELKMPDFDQPCEYKNDGASAGRLFCPGTEIPCQDDPRDKDPANNEAEKGIYECGDSMREPVFQCPY
ncbi:hypothetical protein T440DRAFT_534614 [Plenodomus tracheiphilus IPT5]|uniref:Uncharacterized protein n=1 Tax=Plenodomus tracheiphilus IPT5 TaxID=1408161 RepID=A0A6A7B3X8_9PLEO|nr:hypothetical protein T440DRAFT_534614 [Plenodomus tracheiphilus IPT5]